MICLSHNVEVNNLCKVIDGRQWVVRLAAFFLFLAEIAESAKSKPMSENVGKVYG